MNRAVVIAATVAWGLLVSSEAHADYNEAVNGEFSHNNLAPTPITLADGANIITGTTGTNAGVPGGVDRDYFTFTVPAGFSLLRVDLQQGPVGTDLSFVGVEQGATFTDPTTTTPAQLLGYDLFGASQLRFNILSNIGRGAGSQGFAPPLPAGQYTWWVQEDATPVVNYQFNFVLKSTAHVPAAPSGFLIALSAGLVLMGAGAIRLRPRVS